MTVKEFVDKYNKFNNEESKDKTISDVMVNEYIPYEEKVTKCENIVKTSYYTKSTDRDGSTYDKFHVNSPGNYMLYCLTLVDTYTKIDVDFKNCLKEFNMLNKYITEEYGIIDLIMSKINGRELKEFSMILDLVESDLIKNEYENHAYISDQVERFGKLAGIAITPMIEKLIESVNNIDDSTIDKAANMIDKFSTKKFFNK